ncbi:CLUMA_CG012736, isoform A [Clunio marinus]|uniref:CLUMA_CG012736, isoform A n=1 Tax=Clunio marinus TaxID=568069 RepID=A0A1J1IGA9_9DIPT|nr:CLUMA_CG012736, isoform A [Clunio marinus]
MSCCLVWLLSLHVQLMTSKLLVSLQSQRKCFDVGKTYFVCVNGSTICDMSSTTVKSAYFVFAKPINVQNLRMKQ